MAEQAEVLAGIIGLHRLPFIEITYAGPTDIIGQRIIEAEANAQQVRIHLSGSWDEPSRDGRRQIIGNLAHELAHVWQYALGTPTEALLFHEGFAEAIAIDVLERCGAACDVDAGFLLEVQRTACADAMFEGVILPQTSRLAIYGCGTILARHTAANAGTTPQAVYLRFAETERSKNDFLDVSREMAGSTFANSAFTFLHNDHRLGQPRRVMGLLRQAKL